MNRNGQKQTYMDRNGQKLTETDGKGKKQTETKGSYYSLAELQVTILEQTKFNDEEYRKEREKYFIRKFDTYNDGINLEC